METDLQQSRDRIRDVGRRLLTAQETERARIARELHDDVGQQLALLCLALAESGAGEAVLKRANDIATSVQALSHRLHPAKLQLLGLVASLRGLQREHLRAGIDVVFTHHRVPDDLSPSILLCVFRVVQETLRNAAHHGHARRILVDVRRNDPHLMVTVADDGVGFDVESAWGRGLGLMSIRERVEAADGTLVVRSQPGKGSRFDVSVPLEMDRTCAVAG